MKERFKEQAKLIEEHLQNVFNDIESKKDRLLSQGGIAKTMDYENTAIFSFGNRVWSHNKDGCKVQISYRIFVAVLPEREEKESDPL